MAIGAPSVHYLIPLLIAFQCIVGILILSRAHRRIGIGAAIAFNAPDPLRLGILPVEHSRDCAPAALLVHRIKARPM
jgi:hypothetical protein